MSDYAETMNSNLERDPETAIKQLEAEHRAGNLVSTYLLGKIFFDGIYARPDYQKSIDYWSAGAQRGSLDCEKSLGDCYFFGNGFPEDNLKALEIYQSVLQKNPTELHSLCQIGRMYGYGWGVNKDVPHAIKLLENAWEKGSARAATEIGLLYMFETERNVENVKSAIKWYQRGADKGDPKGCYRMGLLHESGDYGVAKSPKMAYRLMCRAKELTDALGFLIESSGFDVATPEELKSILDEGIRRANFGDASLMGSLGYYYAKIADRKNADFWYEKAIENGDSFSAFRYGVKFAFGMDGYEKNPDKAYKYLCVAAEGGETSAYKTLADLLDDEFITGMSYQERDQKKIYFLTKAAESGDGWAAIDLGRKYANGYSPLERDVEKAIYYYQIAADQNIDSSYLPLGELYMEKSSKTDYGLAYRYLIMAKDHQYTDYFLGEIEYCFGKMSRDGLGRPKNLEEAQAHFANAVSKGYKQAEEELKHFKKGLFGWKLI